MAHNQLPFAVEVDRGRGWEKIAAFNCQPPAVGYMLDCERDNRAMKFKYRVRKSNGKIVAGEGIVRS